MKRLICVLFIAVFLCACNGGPKVRPLEATAVPDAAAVATAMPIATLLLTSTPTPEPTATPTPVCTPTVEPTPTIEPTSTPEPPFTMAWASDTQIMVAYYQEMLPGFTSMCQWIADNAQEQNIVAYLHTGDMVDLCTNREQWALFSKGVELIAPKMPLFMTLGNHDFYNGAAWPVWSEQFFFQQIPEDHRYRDGRASYMEFSTGSTDFLFIQLAYRELNNLTAISWLKSVCDEHADRTVIFLVHGYLTKEGNLMNVAKIVEKELVAKCPNIRLVLSGHSRGISRQVFAYDDDGDGVPERTVNALMYDLQQDRERYGYFCLLTFDPVTRSLSVDSYSPFLDDHIYDDENPDAERFILENVF